MLTLPRQSLLLYVFDSTFSKHFLTQILNFPCFGPFWNFPRFRIVSQQLTSNLLIHFCRNGLPKMSAALLSLRSYVSVIVSIFHTLLNIIFFSFSLFYRKNNDLGFFVNFDTVDALRQAQHELQNHQINENCRIYLEKKRCLQVQKVQKNCQKICKFCEFLLFQILCLVSMALIIAICVYIFGNAFHLL